jgi:hypothetical protein
VMLRLLEESRAAISASTMTQIPYICGVSKTASNGKCDVVRDLWQRYSPLARRK